MHKPFPFNIGADPEFSVFIAGAKADASNVMRAALKGKFVSQNGGYDIKGKCNIGWDGCSSTGEIRPAPAKDPNEVVANLNTAFQEFANNFPIADLFTNSKKAPVGGHIHLEIAQMSDKAQQDINHALGAFYLPLMLNEDSVDLKKRFDTGYGDINDYRCESHGGSRTFEYRAPSAEWLTTPKIAAGTLAYMGTVYAEIVKDPKAFIKKYKKLIWNNKEQGSAMQSMFLSGYTSPIEHLIKSMVKAVKSFEYYPEYEEEIKYVLSSSRVLKDKEAVGYNIMQGWKLEKKSPSKRDLVNDKKAASLAKKIDLDALGDSIHIQYNPDTNVAVFADELKKRIISFGWKLKKKYYLFGLKKGVKDFIAFNKNAERLYDGGQIQTKADAEALAPVIERMNARFSSADIGDYKNHIIIGLPYDMRTDNNFKPFIEMVYRLDKDEFAAKKIKRTDLKENKVSELADIYGLPDRHCYINLIEPASLPEDAQPRSPSSLPLLYFQDGQLDPICDREEIEILPGETNASRWIAMDSHWTYVFDRELVCRSYRPSETIQ